MRIQRINDNQTKKLQGGSIYLPAVLRRRKDLPVPAGADASEKGGKYAFFRVLGSSLLDLIYPRRCPLCQKILSGDEDLICEKCLRILPWVREPLCRKCGKPIEDMEAECCEDCKGRLHAFDEGRSAFIYEKGMRRSVDRMKFYNHREYIPFYARSMKLYAEPILDVWRPFCIIPIPMHPKKRAQRGFDQTLLLAREFSRLTGLPVLENVLLRTRYTRESKKLGRQSRKKNLRGAFSVAEGTRLPERILLMDDIYTTGTTMDEAAAVLRRAGAGEIFFLTLCIGRGN